MLVERLHQHNIPSGGWPHPRGLPADMDDPGQKPDEKGLPWWFGPNYNPSPEMLEGMKNEGARHVPR